MIQRYRIPILLLVILFLCLLLAIDRKERKQSIENEAIVMETAREPEPDFRELQIEGDRYSYEDEHFESLFGIDVSTFQDEIDWQKVKAAGVDFVFIRVGRRGATTGVLYPDDRFEQNYQGAKENGIRVGVYFFSQAISKKEVLEEANWVLKELDGKKIDLPVVFDLEEVFLEDEIARTAGISKETATGNALAFCRKLKEKGYQPMIYTYLYWADNYYDMEQLQIYPIWFAQYDTTEPDLGYPFEVWQYSNSGTIDGITEPVDLDIMFIRKD